MLQYIDLHVCYFIKDDKFTLYSINYISQLN